MDSGEGTSAEHPRCSTKCLPASEAPRLDEASEPEHRPWADLLADILGVVVGLLALVEDRARLRSVCHAWRAVARVHRRPPPPLPLLILSDFSFAIFGADGGTLTGARRRVPLPETAAGGGVRCVGSIEGWLVGVERGERRELGDLRCILTNVFSQDVVVHLPPPSAGTLPLDEQSWSVPIANGGPGMEMNCATNTEQCSMSFCKVILSSSPEPGTGCVVAAISMAEGDQGPTKLGLWRPGMTSWRVCYGSCVRKFTDVIFCHGKLYMLSNSDHATDIFCLELSEEDDGDNDGSGLMVSRVKCLEVEWPDVTDGYHQNWSIVEWNGKLLIVATYTDDADVWQRVAEVRVFVADLRTEPVKFTEIKNLDGDCIFISPCSCKSFRPCQYDGVGVEADCVYFIDGYLSPDKNARPFCKFVYNMRDGTMAPFAEDIPKDKLRAPGGILMHPTWLFPPE